MTYNIHSKLSTPIKGINDFINVSFHLDFRELILKNKTFVGTLLKHHPKAQIII